MSETQHQMVSNYIWRGKRFVECSCGKQFSSSTDSNAASEKWGYHYGEEYMRYKRRYGKDPPVEPPNQHRMISRERHIFQHVIGCSCGKRFSGYGSLYEAERKFNEHRADPNFPNWDTSHTPHCAVCGNVGEYGQRCQYCGSQWVN